MPWKCRNPSHHLPSVPQQWSPSLQRYKYVCGNMQLMDALKSWLLIGRANLTFDQWPLASHSGASPFTSPSSFITTLLITVPVPKNRNMVLLLERNRRWWQTKFEAPLRLSWDYNAKMIMQNNAKIMTAWKISAKEMQWHQTGGTGGYWRLLVAKLYSEIWIHCLKEISDGNAVAIKLAATGGYWRLSAAT